MEFISRITTETKAAEIVEELIKGQTDSYDLGVLFVAPQAQSMAHEIIEILKTKLPIRNLIGCTGAGIIGSHAEIERRSATVLSLAKLPGVKILPFMMNQTQLEGFKTTDDWYNFFEVYPTEKPIFIALPDSFLFDVSRFLDGLNYAYPGCPVIGGLASAASSPGENTLVVNQEERDDGVVGVILTGNVRVDTVVSQGCRPIGKTYIVTKAEGNMIYALAGRPFAEILVEVLKELSSGDQMLAQEAIFVGIAMNEYTHEFKRGDFLIRGLMGIDQTSKAGVIADFAQVGQTIQFHLRDAHTAREDLQSLLLSQQSKESQSKPKGALVFCCNGRGEYLFRQKNHDIEIIQKYLGPVPAAGFFCAGEIGPVGKNNFLHGFTTSIALFYPRD